MSEIPSASPKPCEKEALEICKLQQEIAHARITLWLSILGSALVLAGLGIDRYKTVTQRERDHKLALFNEKREAYLALSDAASAIAACRTYADVEKASTDYNKVYRGRIHVIADTDFDVVRSKVNFHDALEKYLNEKPAMPPEHVFGDLALDITEKCKRHIIPPAD